MPLSHHESLPDVSIVIPVFNKLELTRVCIESILARGAQASFEIIVVDNGSDDGTAQWLARQVKAGRLKAIINQQNQGFSRGCNQGAAEAEGRFILFLNNDMEVMEHWLDPMVTTLDNDPEVGLVGGRLLFPDGSIQHAGVALVRNDNPNAADLMGVHLAYQLPAHSPGACRPLSLQIVTGACLMIRKHIFADLEGFDTGYWNGNEDVDLCLRAGEAGWKVVYRPESRITHYESQSGPERWAKVGQNVTRLNEIWKDRAQPDLIGPNDFDLQPASTNKIRSYTERRLLRPSEVPTEGDTVSVIVLTWNALEYTKQCAASLLEHTDSRHELLFVDNGSRPDTLEYLKNLEREHQQVRVIFNDRNLGFAAGNNVGIAAARGRHVCLLNSDTVVTDRWLENLLAHFPKDAQTGLVGPLTNSITGDQKLETVNYDQDTCGGLGKFAKQLTKGKTGQGEESLWVVGFCVLIRDQLLERLGGLDESFGRGNFEDTDYCLRAFMAGFRSLIAKDSFVHHFGNRSFKDGQLDYHAEMMEKHEIFRQKWNLPPSDPQDCTINPAALRSLGFIPALHFHRLPGLATLPLWDWEKENWLRRGEAFFQEGRLDEAKRVFRQVLDLCPGHNQAANNLACTLWQTQDAINDRPEALKILNEILKRDPENEDARWNLEQMQPETVSV